MPNMSVSEALEHLDNLTRMSFVQDEHYREAYETVANALRCVEVTDDGALDLCGAHILPDLRTSTLTLRLDRFTVTVTRNQVAISRDGFAFVVDRGGRVSTRGFNHLDIRAVRALHLLAEGCPTHKSYRARRAPTADCERCREVYAARQWLNEHRDRLPVLQLASEPDATEAP